ncbi:hypothetical protein ACWCWD_06195 [Streptomyces sp. NPDC001493]
MKTRIRILAASAILAAGLAATAIPASAEETSTTTPVATPADLGWGSTGSDAATPSPTPTTVHPLDLGWG